MAVALEKNNKVYPKDVRKFLMGLYATLHLTDNATAKDVIKLMKYTKEQVYEKFGKTIEAEIEIL